jgi:hypothetical protein
VVFNEASQGATIEYGPGWSGAISGNSPDDIYQG